ncbi:MAG: SAM-dependent methyltransferase [Acidobacteria bacterium]|nr:SAM-dependent methyltransferase [Acidobacteriota bacterium]
MLSADGREPGSANPLERVIAQAVKRAGGKIPFARFMELCLYDPRHGYYQQPVSPIGRRGDYYTAPEVHEVFGRLLGRQVHEMWLRMGRPDDFRVAEMGPGSGRLCHDILSYLRDECLQLFNTLTYALVETNPHRQQEQRILLTPFLGEPSRVLWMDMAQWERGWPFRGCVLSNELVDAFPVHVVVRQGRSFREVYVTFSGGRFREVLDRPSDPALKRYFVDQGVRLEPGQRAEVNLWALRWLRTVSRNLREGYVLTIDYGGLAAEVYEARHFQGTLLCYHEHRTSEDPYVRVGKQDMTAHVNFTALMQEGDKLGLRTVGYAPQGSYLVALGFAEEVEKLSATGKKSELEVLRAKQALKNLILPQAMGERFKVLLQCKGPEALVNLRAVATKR